jgi:dephospho-CoA kinase
MKKIIWISGRLGCWKTIISEYLRDKYWLSIYENSDILRQEAKSRWIEPVRDKLIDIAQELQEKYWKQIIVERLLSNIDDSWIISGIRLFEQAKYLRENSDFLLIYIETTDDIVFDRIVSRDRYWDPVDKQDFERLLKKDWLWDLPKLKEYSDFVIENNWTLENLYKKIDIFIEEKFKK